MCLYGTRDAAKGWQKELSSHLRSLGFEQGRGHPAVFCHAQKGLLTLVHGDDYVSSGPADSLTWLDKELGKKYKVKTQRISGSSDGRKTGTLVMNVLNRIVRWTQHGYEVEADPRHSELVVDELLELCDREVATPGVDETEKGEEEEAVELQAEQAKKFRSVAARCNYLSQDRPDILFITKEMCREMAKPSRILAAPKETGMLP